MTDRDDSNLKHYQSRSRQPKLLASPSTANHALNRSPVNVFLVFDQSFGSISDQVDDTRFKYMGTSPATRYEGLGNRVNHGAMRDSFQAYSSHM